MAAARKSDLQIWREEFGISRRKLARQTGLAYGTLDSIERGRGCTTDVADILLKFVMKSDPKQEIVSWESFVPRRAMRRER